VIEFGRLDAHRPVPRRLAQPEFGLVEEPAGELDRGLVEVDDKGLAVEGAGRAIGVELDLGRAVGVFENQAGLAKGVAELVNTRRAFDGQVSDVDGGVPCRWLLPLRLLLDRRRRGVDLVLLLPLLVPPGLDGGLRGGSAVCWLRRDHTYALVYARDAIGLLLCSDELLAGL
jgi:hypothetical protein